MEEIKEMLQQMMGRFDNLEGRFDGLEGRFDGLEARMDQQFAEVNEQLVDIRQQLDRIEQSQNDDVIAILERIETKAVKRLDQHDHRIELLNERLLHVEADLRPLIQKS